MIKLVKNGTYFNSSIVVRVYLGEVEVTDDGIHPRTFSVLDAFNGFPLITEEELVLFTEDEFQTRLDALKLYIESLYSGVTFENESSGVDYITCLPESFELPVTPDTKITIFFDSSGSMNATLPPLVTMRDTLLKDHLLPFYNNDEVLYNSMVKIINDGSERTFRLLHNRVDGLTGRNLVMVFQDEANPVYHFFNSTGNLNNTIRIDLNALKNAVNSLPINYYRGVIFQVIRDQSEGESFKQFLLSIQNGISPYIDPWNLVGRFELNYAYDVTAAGTPEYYMDLVLNKMRELGYQI